MPGSQQTSGHLQKRWKNPSNLEIWESGVTNGFSLNDYEDFSKLTDESVAEDAILFGLRMNQGINLREIAERFQLGQQYMDDLGQFFEKLLEEGLTIKRNEFISLTKDGRIRADAIAAELPVGSGNTA